MILSMVVFFVTFAAVFALYVALLRRREAKFEAEQEIIARRAQEQQVAEAKSDDMWRANKRLGMR